jgi:hypothetical protein
MVLSKDLKTRLLTAIETDSLIFLCGAGLSMPSPSDLPSAERVAEICFDSWIPVEDLDPLFRQNIEKIADHFYARGDFEKAFIRLVPWNELVGPPNQGHAAISDLLICRAAHCALSSNFDSMIERWAEEHKVALQGALTGQEAVEFESTSAPLLKFHGCMQRSREKTLWTQAQLADASVQARVQSCSEWMNLHLPGKHLVVIGFWSDWGYLNNVLQSAFSIDNARSVTVVDPSATASLQSKAPDLWTKLNGLSHSFEHVQASGVDFLNELRIAYSQTWVRKFYVLGAPLIASSGAPVPAAAAPDGLSDDDFYNFRRDAEGVPYNRAATHKVPSPDMAQVALVHMQFFNAGATRSKAWFERGGNSIRIINGAGQGFEQVQERYREPAAIPQSDIVVCVGAIQLGVPAKLIPSGSAGSIVRPAGGGPSSWLTREQAQVTLGI